MDLLFIFSSKNSCIIKILFQKWRRKCKIVLLNSKGPHIGRHVAASWRAADQWSMGSYEIFHTKASFWYDEIMSHCSCQNLLQQATVADDLRRRPSRTLQAWGSSHTAVRKFRLHWSDCYCSVRTPLVWNWPGEGEVHVATTECEKNWLQVAAILLTCHPMWKNFKPVSFSRDNL